MRQTEIERDARSVEESEKAFHDAKSRRHSSSLARLIYKGGFSSHVCDPVLRPLLYLPLRNRVVHKLDRVDQELFPFWPWFSRYLSIVVIRVKKGAAESG